MNLIPNAKYVAGAAETFMTKLAVIWVPYILKKTRPFLRQALESKSFTKKDFYVYYTTKLPFQV